MDPLEASLNKTDLVQLIAMLADLQRAFAGLQMGSDDDTRKAVLAGLECVIAGMRVMELARQLHEGKPFEAALRATVLAELKMDPGVAAQWEAHLNSVRGS